MNEEMKNEASLDAIQAQAEELATELKAASRSAGRQWKITAWVYGILCVVIATYLGFIYATFRPYIRADFIEHNWDPIRRRG